MPGGSAFLLANALSLYFWPIRRLLHKAFTLCARNTSWRLGMCTALFELCYDEDKDGITILKFIMTHNRDEFYERATSPIEWWSSPHEAIFARKLNEFI
jgi:hypothetical protein